ncbi:hypothetical protein FA13DRAFT_1729393 [Coprinellus micaceus]|uniref:Uncharacterized protein n=1 Tax=Coprinellus micaceus TaxID=71717 RepID=A0A4Y7TKN3_COPMI|nr:hypothetical protein FA13DRAFT_1729393 [Coprinellus micaceus]
MLILKELSTCLSVIPLSGSLTLYDMVSRQSTRAQEVRFNTTSGPDQLSIPCVSLTFPPLRILTGAVNMQTKVQGVGGRIAASADSSNRSLVTFLSVWRYLAPMRFEVTTDGYAAPWRPAPKMDGNDASLAPVHTFGGYGKTTHSQSRPSRATRMRLLFSRVGRQFPDLTQVDMGSLPSNTTLISGDGEVVPYPRGTEGTSQTQWQPPLCSRRDALTSRRKSLRRHSLSFPGFKTFCVA